jgi:hypothetical protein
MDPFTQVPENQTAYSGDDENASAEMVVAFKEIVVTAARKIDQGITDVEAKETWQRVKMHGISLDQHLAQRSGGLEKLRQEIQAENEAIAIPVVIG